EGDSTGKARRPAFAILHFPELSWTKVQGVFLDFTFICDKSPALLPFVIVVFSNTYFAVSIGHYAVFGIIQRERRS
ncbi:MAG TPA: hypothetical protein DCO75_03205, partial [Fibrobacteres bacterium]|nr:hypothetical protein [Fibrobacterota bacterium]